MNKLKNNAMAQTTQTNNKKKTTQITETQTGKRVNMNKKATTTTITATINTRKITQKSGSNFI